MRGSYKRWFNSKRKKPVQRLDGSSFGLLKAGVVVVKNAKFNSGLK
jgi:hypothetical protein